MLMSIGDVVPGETGLGGRPVVPSRKCWGWATPGTITPSWMAETG